MDTHANAHPLGSRPSYQSAQGAARGAPAWFGVVVLVETTSPEAAAAVSCCLA